jgi:hypothetical protein
MDFSEVGLRFFYRREIEDLHAQRRLGSLRAAGRRLADVTNTDGRGRNFAANPVRVNSLV